MVRQFLILFVLACVPVMADDLASLSDDFSNASTLKNWSRLYVTEGWGAEKLERWDIRDGSMTMMPYTCTWYRDYVGPMVYKEVAGDFVFTTHVEVTSRAKPAGGGVPASDFSLGGVMVRTPRSHTSPAQWQRGGENYVFLSLGHGNGAPQMQFEVKTTTGSNSDLQLSPAGTNEATIRWARVGNALIALRQSPGEKWTVHRRYSRPDMPKTVQVGFVTYTDWPKASSYAPEFQNSHALNSRLKPDPSNKAQQPFRPALIAKFEYATFARPNVPANLAGKNFADPGQVSDGDILGGLAASGEEK